MLFNSVDLCGFDQRKIDYRARPERYFSILQVVQFATFVRLSWPVDRLVLHQNLGLIWLPKVDMQSQNAH